ncbi:protein kinase domain-containing protein [Planctomycetaceae bacterium SH139]
MQISQLSARHLAEIDSLSIEFERSLRGRPKASHVAASERLPQDVLESMIAATLNNYAGNHREILETELRAVAAEMVGSNQRLADWFQPGMRIGPYLLEARIGRGGMGEVYRGRDTRLDRDVAIKVLIEQLDGSPDDQQRFDRFDREARAIAGLSHPAIVSLYDVGQHQGRPFAVMELLKGVTVRERLRQAAPLSPEETRFIGGEAADALAAAHAMGIVHRDLKPENLFITEEGRVKLLDFGLSRNDSARGGGDEATVSGVILGTAGYLSPEQAKGGQVSVAADLFSLGCVLYECFFGYGPFQRETFAESLAAIINAQPEYDPTRVADDPRLVDLIAACLVKEPGERLADAQRLACQLRGDVTIDGDCLPSPTTARLNSRPKPHPSPHPTTAIADRPTESVVRQMTVDESVHAHRFPRRRFLQAAGWTGLVAAGVAASSSLGRWLKQPAKIQSIAVMPLEDGLRLDMTPLAGMNTRDLGIGEQMAAAIANQLTRVPDLRVYPYLPLRNDPAVETAPVAELANGSATNRPADNTAQAGNAAHAGDAAQGPSTEPPALASRGVKLELARYQETGQQLGVDAVLIGTVITDGDGYQTIDVQLIDSQSGFQICSYNTRVKQETNLIEQQEIAEQVAAGIGRELAGYNSGEPRSNASYHCLVNGYARMDPDSTKALRDAMGCFRSAVRQDAKFAEAHAGIALTAMILLEQAAAEERADLIQQARQAVAQVRDLRVDSNTAELAAAVLAWQADWDFAEAERIFAERVPKMTLSWVAQYEYAVFLAARGRWRQAFEHAQQATSLDKMSVAFQLQAARLTWLAGDANTAINQVRAMRAAYDGRARELAIGFELDVLESRQEIPAAQQLLAEHTSHDGKSDYWIARAASLNKLPYGPYGVELNEAILTLRRAPKVEEGWLLRLKSEQAARLPFLVSAHPAFSQVRQRTILRDLVGGPLRQS